MKVIFACALICALVGVADLFGTEQSVAVVGVLLCKDFPSAGTKVKLYDVDRFTSDDLLSEGVTDEVGHFKLQGRASELTNIDPELNIYHNCHAMKTARMPGWGPCLKKFSIKIPDDYITKGKIPNKTFDAGTLHLENSFSGQYLDCFS